MVHLLFDIPKVQQVDLLSSWLRIADVAALDSATCSNKWRPEFLDLLCSPELTLSGCYFSRNFLDRWIILRKVAFADIHLCSNTLSKDLTRNVLFKILGPKLANLTLDCEQGGWSDEGEPRLQIDQILFDATQHCKSLRTFTIDSANLDGTLSFLINANQLLQEITIRGCRNITSSVLKAIVQSSHLNGLYLHQSLVADLDTLPVCGQNMQCLMLNGRNCKMKPNVLSWLCQSMPNLQKLHVDVQTGQDLVSIASHCRHITVASITLESVLSVGEARSIAKHWQSVELFTLLRSESKKHLPVCDEAVVMVFINKCHSLLQLKLAPSDGTTSGSSFYSYTCIMYDSKNAALSKLDNKRSRLTDLFVPCLSAQALATIVAKCVYLNTLRILRPASIIVDANAAEFALHHLAGTNIKTLHISNCSNLNPTHLLPLQGMQKLVLCNSGLATLRSLSIISMCQRSPELRALYIRNCPGIDHFVILAVLDKCPMLTHFEFYAQDRDTTQSVVHPAVYIMTQLIRKDYPNIRHFAAQF